MAERKTDNDTGSFGPVTSEADRAEKGRASESAPLRAAPRLGATITIQLDPDQALLFRRAARLLGSTKTELVRRFAVAEAAKVVARAEGRDSRRATA
jgi:hypothetical protein